MPNFVQKATATIKGSFSGHKELNQYITSHKEIKSSLKAWSAAQLNASKCLDKWGSKEAGDLGDMIAKVHELEIKWCEQQTAMITDVKASKKAFVSILKQEQAADYADRSSQQAMKQVSKAEKTLAALKKKGANTATAETKLRQAQSIYEMCDNEKSSMSTRTNRVKARQLKRAMVANAEAHLELFRQGIILFEAQKVIAESLSLEDDEEEMLAQAALEEQLGGSYRPRSASVPRSQSDQLPDRPMTFCGAVGSPASRGVDLAGHSRFASWGGSPNRSGIVSGDSNTDASIHSTTSGGGRKGKGSAGSDMLINDISLTSTSTTTRPSQPEHSPGSIRSQRVQSRMSQAAAAQDSDCSGFSGTGRSAMFLPSSFSPSRIGNSFLNRTAELQIFSPARKAPSVPFGISPHGAEPLYASPESAHTSSAVAAVVDDVSSGNDDAHQRQHDEDVDEDNNSHSHSHSHNTTDAITNANTVANSHYSTTVNTTVNGFTPGHSRTGSNGSSKSRGKGKGHSRNSSTGSAVILTEAHAAATTAAGAAGAAGAAAEPAASTAMMDASLNLTHITLANASFISQDTAWAQSAWSDHGSTDDVAAAVAAAAAAAAADTYNHPQDDVTYQPPSIGADSGVGGGGPASMNSDTFAGMEFTSDTRANSVNSAYQNVADVDFEDDGVAHYENVANLSKSGSDGGGGSGGNGGGIMVDPYESDPESGRNSAAYNGSGVNSANHSPDGYGFHNRSGAATAELQSEDEGMLDGMDDGDADEMDRYINTAGTTTTSVMGMVAQANLQPIIKYSAFNTIPVPKSSSSSSSSVDPATEYI